MGLAVFLIDRGKATLKETSLFEKKKKNVHGSRVNKRDGITERYELVGGREDQGLRRVHTFLFLFQIKE